MADASPLQTHTFKPYKPKRGEAYMSDGQLDHFSDILNAWKRELMEELGLEIEIDSFFGIFMDRYGDGGFSTLYIFYICRNKNLPKYVADDISGYDWFPLSSLPEKIAFESAHEVLTKLKTTYLETK